MGVDPFNHGKSRSAAAKTLAELVSNHKFAEGETLNIVARSHGGNVVFEATKNGLDRKIDNLVTLGTPIRTDYRPNYGKIGTFLNVYSREDRIQTSGGQWFVFGSADRQLRSPHVRNVDATSVANGHSELWRNTKVWTTIVAPKLKK